jgi:ketosteroid isomerase-like protein
MRAAFLVLLETEHLRIGEKQMRSFLGIIILTAAGVTAALGQCSQVDIKALEAFDRAWGEAGANGDRAALTNIYADDYYGIPDMRGKKSTIDGTMAQFEASKANPSGADKVTHDHYMITCTPNSAFITHRNVVSAALAPGGRPGIIYTRSVHTLEKRSGKWQVTSNATHGMDDAMTIAYLEQDWNDASAKRDKDWFEKNFAADYVSVSSRTAKVYDKAGDIADTMSDKGTNELTETSDMDINVDGNRALVIGVFHSKGKDDKGVAYDRRIRFTDTWIRREGRWVAWSTTGVNIP